jgi:FAD/FMN-containing dehydrogenase
MALFNQINYNTTTSFVDVGPAQIWDNVSNYLVDNYKVNVNGATTCKGVGVGGFNLGGGYGNKSNQFGLAIDNIQAIEVVLPTGEIVTANAESNADLFLALKVRSWLW